MTQYPVAAPVTLEGLDANYETAKLGLNEVILDSANSIRDYTPLLYNKATFKQLQMKKKVYSGLPQAQAWQSTLGAIPSVGLEYLWDITAQHYWFAQGTEYTLESKTFDEYSILSKLSTELGKAMGEKKQRLAADFFNNGFTADWNDGVKFFSALHPYDPRYGSTDKQANLQAGALSVTTLHDAVNKLINVRDPLGRPMNYLPKRLWVYPTQVMFAKQILGYDMNVEYGTPNNNRNPFADFQIEVAPYPWFSSPTMWMLQANETDTYYSQPVGLKTNIEETPSHATKLEAWFCIAFWAERWQGWVGSLGT